jgi:ABC-2 type transport system permease protein
VHAAVTILAKDLRLRLRDRSVLLFAVVVPLGLTVLFSGIFPDTEELRVTAAVVDQDGGEVAAGFTEGLLPALVEDGVVVLEDVADEDDARGRLDTGELDAAWIIPAGFTERVRSGEAAELEVLVNADRALPGEVARGIAGSYATQLTSISLAVATTGAAAGGELTGAQLDQVVALASGADPLVTVTDLVAPGRQLDTISYLAAGMAAFFVFFTVQWGVTGMLEEKQLGTAPRLLAAPIAPWSIQVGKAFGAALLGLVSLTVLAVAGNLLLGAEWGPPLGVAILIVALVLAAVGLMGLVGSFARTSEQASNAQSIVAIVLGMVGGVFFPLPGDHAVVRVAATVSPHAWFLRGLGDGAATGAWTAVLPAAGAIAAFGLAAAIPAAWLLHRANRW